MHGHSDDHAYDHADIQREPHFDFHGYSELDCHGYPHGVQFPDTDPDTDLCSKAFLQQD